MKKIATVSSSHTSRLLITHLTKKKKKKKKKIEKKEGKREKRSYDDSQRQSVHAQGYVRAYSGRRMLFRLR